MKDANSKRIGLFAAWGRYPVVVAEAMVAQGYEVYCLGVKDHADEAALRPLCKVFQWNGIARYASCVRFWRKHGVARATMAGKIHKTTLYRPWVWLHHVPDYRAVKMFYKSFGFTEGDRRDDTLLTTIINEFAKDDIEFAPATDFAPELLVKYGQLGRRAPSTLERKDVEFGWQLAKEMGRLDIGQSVAVKGRNALAIEAIEGTDACIRRAGELCRSGNFTIVKVAKPQQDMRFDVPTIGVGTLEQMVAAGATCLAIESGKTIVIDQPEVVRFADRHGIAIVALECGEQALTEADRRAA
ncbi:MAG: UDP-2,3-diacylglucosamine diphosphatase LpxI [Pirellulales bacterium]